MADGINATVIKTKFHSRNSCWSSATPLPPPCPLSFLLLFVPLPSSPFPSLSLPFIPSPASNLTDFRLLKDLMNYSFRLFQAFSHDRKNYPFFQERKKRFSYQQSWQGARQPLEQSVGIRMPEVDIPLQEHSHAGASFPQTQ